MSLLRGIFVLIGLGAIGAVTYGTVMATGGFSTDAAPLYIALGCVQAALAFAFGRIGKKCGVPFGTTCLMRSVSPPCLPS